MWRRVPTAQGHPPKPPAKQASPTGPHRRLFPGRQGIAVVRVAGYAGLGTLLPACAEDGMTTRTLLAAFCCLPLTAPPLAAQAKPAPPQVEFFERHVRPVLVEHCF